MCYVFQLSLESCVEVRTPLKEKYVEWAVMTKGIKKARKLYKRYDMVHVYCLSVFVVV